MKKIIALGASNSKNSINKTLAIYAAKQIENTEILVIDLNDFDIPLYGIDIETADGIPSEVIRLSELFKQADGFVVSLAEHNGSYTAAFKNVFDWLSRINSKVWNNKPMLLMATSPGARGGKEVLQSAKDRFPRMGANLIADFSLPSFHDNFSGNDILNKELKIDLTHKINKLKIEI
ncbi:MAG: NAD(P)H-dependent oxidoreductase [Flavobacteriaceae bacterium]|nr:NAD(P)H-dependent oxidoreductase [Flavobacteriaceae bacterium]